MSQGNSPSPHICDSDGRFPWLCESDARWSEGLGSLFLTVTGHVFLKCQKSSGFHSEILAMSDLPRLNHTVPGWKVLDYSLTME